MKKLLLIIYLNIKTIIKHNQIKFRFFEVYKNERKFFKISHEGSLEVVKFIDDSLYKFLNKIFNNYFDEHSVIFLIIVHGGQILVSMICFSEKKKN